MLQTQFFTELLVSSSNSLHDAVQADAVFPTGCDYTCGGLGCR